ncbi:hypothetical protein GGR53DRAFT_469814 [Hypoxylon sp. FL1150]|nr:hypothetical protein GGR53DRAFT_469814 [Hypoxylon sp. FL1150]
MAPTQKHGPAGSHRAHRVRAPVAFASVTGETALPRNQLLQHMDVRATMYNTIPLMGVRPQGLASHRPIPPNPPVETPTGAPRSRKKTRKEKAARTIRRPPQSLPFAGVTVSGACYPWLATVCSWDLWPTTFTFCLSIPNLGSDPLQSVLETLFTDRMGATRWFTSFTEKCSTTDKNRSNESSCRADSVGASFPIHRRPTQWLYQRSCQSYRHEWEPICCLELKQLLKRMVVKYQLLKCENIGRNVGNLAVFKAFKICLQAAYNKNIQLMKEFFVLFVEDTHYWVLKEQPFGEHKDGYPPHQ